MRRNQTPDPEDLFSDTRMSFGDHIEDLRSHLLKALYGLAIGLLIAMPFGNIVLKFIAKPVEDQLGIYYRRYYNDQAVRVVRDKVKLPPMQIALTFDAEEVRNALDLPPNDK